MRVTQLLALRELHPTLPDAIRALPPGTPERYVAERRLRSVSSATMTARRRPTVKRSAATGAS